MKTKKYLKKGLFYGVLGFVFMNGLAHAGFESEMQAYSEKLLGSPFHYAAAILFAFTSFPLFKQNDWGGILSRAGLCTAADIIANQIFSGGISAFFKG
jgi:hypothetical protein